MHTTCACVPRTRPAAKAKVPSLVCMCGALTCHLCWAQFSIFCDHHTPSLSSMIFKRSGLGGMQSSDTNLSSNRSKYVASFCSSLGFVNLEGPSCQYASSKTHLHSKGEGSSRVVCLHHFANSLDQNPVAERSSTAPEAHECCASALIVTAPGIANPGRVSADSTNLTVL